MADNIDNLSFGIILKDEDFKKKMNEVKGLAKTFSDDVAKALALTNALQAAQGKSVGNTDKKARKQKEIVTLTREELEAKKAAGTATKAELQQLNAYLRSEKLLLDEEKKKVQLQKEQVMLKRQENLLNHGTSKDINLTSARLIQQSGIMKGLISMAAQYFSVFGAMSLVRNLVRITGEFEAQHTALRAILQDNAAADNIYNQLQVLAVKSPFTFQNLVGYAKQLTAFSVPVNEVYETTKKLADVSAGLGVDMGRIILAYGQVRSAEFLRGQEVRQFTEAGIPILKELADQFQEIEGHAISVGEVFDRISARQVPFAMVEEVFNRMTSAGGKFYQMQEVLAETVKGKVSNLQDAWEIMLSKIGDENSGIIKGAINWITNLLQNYEKWIGLLGAVIKGIGLYSASLLALNTITQAANGFQILRNGFMLIGNQQVKLSNILLPTNIALQKLSIKNTEEEAAALAALNLARKATVGVLMALIAVTSSAFQSLKRRKEEARKTTDVINSALSKLSITMADFNIGANRVNDAFVKMKSAEGDATEETKAFNKSVDDLKKQFPKFIDDHIKMAQTVDELGQYWARAREEMNQYYADEARETLNTDLKQGREDNLGDLQKEFSKYIQKQITKEDWRASGSYISSLLWQYVSGGLTENEIGSVISQLSALKGRKQVGPNGSIVDYSDEILEELNGFARQFKSIQDGYTKAIKEGEAAIAARGLTTTRANYNDLLFSLLAASGWGWSFDGKNFKTYSEFNESEQQKIKDWWLKNNDLAVGVDETVEEWAKRQRGKLAASNTSEKVKGVIREVFKQMGILENPNELAPWQKDVNDIIAKNGGRSGDFVKATDSLDDLIDKWIKEMNELDDSLKKFPTKEANMSNANYASLVGHRSLLWAISEGLYGKGVKDFSGNTKQSKKEAKKAIADATADLKQQYQDLKELKAAYDEFKKLGFDDTQIGTILNNYLGVGIPEGGFGAAFESLASQMEKYDKNDARDIRNFAAGKDWREYAKSIEDARTASEKFADFLKSWNVGDETEGDGAAYKVTKIISDYIKSLDDLDDKRADATERLDEWIAAEKKAGTVIDDNVKNQKKEAIQTKYSTASTNLLNKAMYDLQKTADDLVKEWLSITGIDVNNWSDKSVSELKALKKELDGLADEQIIERLGGSWEMLVAKLGDTRAAKFLGYIREVIASIGEDTDKALGKKNLQNLKYAAEQLSKLAENLGEVGDFVSDVSDVVSAAGQGAKQGGWVGALVSAIVVVGSKLLEDVSYAKELRTAIREAGIEAQTARWDAILGSSDTIFGDSAITKLRNIAKVLDETSSSLSRLTKKILLRPGSSFAWDVLEDSFEKGYNRYESILVKAIDRSLFSNSVFVKDKYMSLRDMVEELGYEFYDEYGDISAEAVQAILNSYDKLGEADRAWMEEYVANKEEQKKALEELDTILNQIFGQIAGDMMDSMIESFKQTGVAVADLDTAFANLGDTIVRTLGEGMLIEMLSEKYAPMLREAFKKYGADKDEKALVSTFAEFKASLKEDALDYTNFMQLLLDTVDQSVGLLPSSGEVDSLSNGIKSITEDTANLLASYVNAIRADVSYGKSQRERIIAALEGNPMQYTTLNDYMMQVQANTANIAESNRQILERIESVMTVEGGASAIRIYS